MPMSARDRPWLRRWNWNLLLTTIPLAYFVVRVSLSGFTTLRTIGLCSTAFWFAVVVIDRMLGHRISDWIYSDDEDPGAPTGETSAPREWIERIVVAVPALRASYEQHVQDNDGLLPHVYLGDVTRFVVRGFRTGSGPEQADAESVLSFLEEALGSPRADVQTLVSLSFVENLLGEEPLERIRAAMGPRLKAELAAYPK
jgi:hypothetical protein